MSKLPDGTNPYGRLLKMMHETASDEVPAGIVKGEYLGGGSFSIGDHTFDRDEVLILQNQITIDGVTFDIPGLEDQEHTVTRTVTHSHGSESFSFDVGVPAIQKGDEVIAYQFGDEEYVIIGKVV